MHLFKNDAMFTDAGIVQAMVITCNKILKTTATGILITQKNAAYNVTLYNRLNLIITI